MKLLSIILTFYLKMCIAPSIAQTYTHLEGKIGDQDAAMDLIPYQPSEREGSDRSSYNGYYYYLNEQVPISVYQSDLENGEHGMKLIVWGNNEENAKFIGEFKNNSFHGVFHNGDVKFDFQFKIVDNTIPISRFNEEKIIHIPEINIEDGPVGRISFEWYAPTDKKLRSDLVSKITDGKYDDFDQWVASETESFEKDYQQEVKDFLEYSKEDENPYYHSLNHEYTYSLVPTLNTEKYLVLMHTNYMYMGGAHGYYASTYHTYDKSKKKWISVSDVFDVSEEERIGLVIDKEVRKIHGIPADINLDDAEQSIFLAEKMHYTPNITIHSKGVKFHYTIYEVTPYAHGEYEVLVPYEKLLPYMNKTFKY